MNEKENNQNNQNDQTPQQDNNDKDHSHNGTQVDVEGLILDTLVERMLEEK